MRSGAARCTNDLFQAFYNYWERRGLKLKEPELPLTALIFADQALYERSARSELGDAAGSVVGFYSLRTNRVTMFDLTGSNGLRGPVGRFTSTAQINSLLMQPGAERLVATIIHEATHQIAYNFASHMRDADIPQWVSEGLAVFFETPDSRSSQGWRNIGGVSASRLAQFRRYLATRESNSLRSLVEDDKRFRQTSMVLDAYGEAWALQHFLITTRLGDYVRYLKKLSEKPLLIYDTPAERWAEFREAFGADPQRWTRSFCGMRHVVPAAAIHSSAGRNFGRGLRKRRAWNRRSAWQHSLRHRVDVHELDRDFPEAIWEAMAGLAKNSRIR